jgi:hypothetical protein
MRGWGQGGVAKRTSAKNSAVFIVEDADGLARLEIMEAVALGPVSATLSVGSSTIRSLIT